MEIEINKVQLLQFSRYPHYDKWKALLTKQLTIIQDLVVPKEFQTDIEQSLQYAPSVITRGDAQILNVSAPRFAIRAYLDKRKCSWVNLRRLLELREQVPQEWNTTRHAKRRETLETAPVSHTNGMAPNPRRAIGKSSPIGDCLLRFSNPDYHVIEVDLHEACGVPRDSQEIKLGGTPYVHGIEVIGVCAQAAAFMMTMCLADHAQCVLSLCEITHLAIAENTDARFEEFEVRALSPIELVHYFTFPNSGPGLNAFYEIYSRSFYPQHLDSERWLRESLMSYVNSNIPVTLPIDLNRADGRGNNFCLLTAEESLYKIHNNPPIETELFGTAAPSTTTVLHTIVVVGVERPTAQRTDPLFLINDPSHLPFLRASASDLMKYRPYNTEGLLQEPSFVVAVPPAVKIALNTHITNDHQIHWGIRNLSSFLPFSALFRFLSAKPYACNASPAFSLVKIDESNINDWSLQLNNARVALVLVQALTEWIKQKKPGVAWFWLQYSTDFIIAWNAENQGLNFNHVPQTDAALQQWLLKSFYLKDGLVENI